MRRHAFGEAVLEAERSTRSEKLVLRWIPVDSPHADGRASLLQRIAEANQCRSIFFISLGLSTVGGITSDLDSVELLYGSLIVQATQSMLAHGSIKSRYGHSQTASLRRSFMFSFASHVGERLDEEGTGATTQAASEYGHRRPAMTVLSENTTPAH